MVALELVVLDVHETLADFEPLRQRFTGSGAPEHLLDNLVCRHAARRFRARSDRAAPAFSQRSDGPPERAAQSCRRPALPVNEAVAGGLEGVKELQVHPHVPDGLRVPVNAGHGSAVLTGRGADGSRC